MLIIYNTHTGAQVTVNSTEWDLCIACDLLYTEGEILKDLIVIYCS